MTPTHDAWLAAERDPQPKFAVRIERGLVTHWLDKPLMTYAEADACREGIEEWTGERGQIEEVLLSVKL